jgi:UDP-N-acetylmuramoyl-tripeptide--D-alanyl-D-alanine ligase
VKYSAAEILVLLRTPLGRHQFAVGLHHRAWPVYRGTARLYRRVMLRNTWMVAVTGTFGKSTTVRAINAALLDDSSLPYGANAWSAIARGILKTRPSQTYATFEVGVTGAGQMAQYARLLRPDHVVVTSIGSEHRTSFGNLEQTRHEKAELVRTLDSGKSAFLNGDDPHVLWMKTQTRASVVTFGRSPGNDVVAENVALDWPHGMRITIRAGTAQYHLRVRLLGEKMVYPILAAFAVGLAERRPCDEMIESLESLAPTPGRLETIKLDSGAFLVRDEHKSALETIDAALDVLDALPAKRKWIVIGDVSEPPGSQGPIYRRLGERMAGIATYVIVFGGGFQPYAAGCRRAGLSRERIIRGGHDTAGIAQLLGEQLRSGDVVLIKGRDTQKLDRISLLLQGRVVGCRLKFCGPKLRCVNCPMVESGWRNRQRLA